MHRYFVAIPLPPEIRERLAVARPSVLRGLRRVAIHDLHLTLHFLGELTLASVDLVQRSLEQVESSRFTMTIQSVGVFPPKGRPAVLWAGVQSNPELSRLHASVGVALMDAIGFQVEKRPYSPHVTLARFQGPPPAGFLDDYLSTNRAFQIPDVPVTQFTLFSSHQVDGRYQYSQEAVFELQPV